jgi:hypothetical protein
MGWRRSAPCGAADLGKIHAGFLNKAEPLIHGAQIANQPENADKGYEKAAVLRDPSPRRSCFSETPPGGYASILLKKSQKWHAANAQTSPLEGAVLCDRQPAVAVGSNTRDVVTSRTGLDKIQRPTGSRNMPPTLQLL